MAKASDNLFPSILIAEGSTPAAPAAGGQRLFLDSADDTLKRIDSAGVVSDVGSGSSASVSVVGASITRQATAQSIPSASLTVISWDTEEFDVGGFFTSATPTRVTIPTGMNGYYALSGQIAFAATAGGAERTIAFRKNGTTNFAYGTAYFTSSAPSTPNISGRTVYLTAGDYIEVTAYQNSGSSVNTLVSVSNVYTYFNVIRLGS